MGARVQVCRYLFRIAKTWRASSSGTPPVLGARQRRTITMHNRTSAPPEENFITTTNAIRFPGVRSKSFADVTMLARKQSKRRVLFISLGPRPSCEISRLCSHVSFGSISIQPELGPEFVCALAEFKFKHTSCVEDADRKTQRRWRRPAALTGDFQLARRTHSRSTNWYDKSTPPSGAISILVLIVLLISLQLLGGGGGGRRELSPLGPLAHWHPASIVQRTWRLCRCSGSFVRRT